jgi:hypothetical protein
VKPDPFPIIRRNGIVWVDKRIDQEFRKALLQGVPPILRPKMQEALSAYPDDRARAHSERYFKGEVEEIVKEIAPLLIALNHVLSHAFNLPGLFDWLNVTHYGDSYKMIKVFREWAAMKRSGEP